MTGLVSEAAAPVRPRLNASYIELKRTVTAAGLLERQPLYYACKFAFTLGLLAVAILVLLLARSLWLVLLDAVLLGFVYGQVGLLGHDTGHNGIFAGSRANRLLAPILGNLLMGMSHGWWTTSHNQHHATSNRLGVDGEIEYPFFAMDEQQIPLKIEKGVGPKALFVMQWQHYLAWPILALVGLNLRRRSQIFLRNRSQSGRRVEIILLAIHWLLYIPLVFGSQGLKMGLLFVLVHEAVFGFYVGLITATNHWGMPLIADPPPLDFLSLQVVTSRNVAGGPLVDFLFGGLEHQIEHHLFPSMPRNNLRRAAPMVREACRREGIPYRSTGVAASLRDIYVALRRVAFAVRSQKLAFQV